MNTYRNNAAARVYWVKLPVTRSAPRAAIGKVVNAAIDVASDPYRSQVRLIDTSSVFTPKGYRDSMEIDGSNTIVRQPDGVHLNEAGSDLLAKMVLERIGQDFALNR
jgi:hypothetical protein